MLSSYAITHTFIVRHTYGRVNCWRHAVKPRIQAEESRAYKREEGIYVRCSMTLRMASSATSDHAILYLLDFHAAVSSGRRGTRTPDLPGVNRTL